MTITFRVYGIAQPKGNLKAYTPRGMKFPIVTDSNRSVKSWSQLVAETASRTLNEAALRQGAGIARGFMIAAVRVRVAFALPRPKSIKARTIPHLTAPDIDKLSRSVLDALSGVLYRDDSQVVELHATKYYAPHLANPYCDVSVEGIDPDSTISLSEITARGMVTR